MTTASNEHPPIVVVGPDTTLRWPCRENDFIIWFRWRNVLLAPQLCVLDLWALRDGDSVTITNRVVDLPIWFKLHPTEAADLLAYEMARKLEQGYEPGDPVEGPNLWRLEAGDRLAWLGDSRPGYHTHKGLLALVDFRECALAIGDSARDQDLFEFVGFGAIHAEPGTRRYEEDTARCRAALKVVQRLGIPRIIQEGGWALR